jgi:hypothetical protein
MIRPPDNGTSGFPPERIIGGIQIKLSLMRCKQLPTSPKRAYSRRGVAVYAPIEDPSYKFIWRNTLGMVSISAVIGSESF